MLNLRCSEHELRGELKRNESMGAYTSFQAGGRAEIFYRPQDLEDVCFFLANLPDDIPVVWLGLGSNTLIQDGGIKGAVICTRHVLGDIRQLDNGDIYAQAGVTCARLSKFSIALSLAGGEFFAGIPGTVGGALAMNAGAFEGVTWEAVQQVELLNRQGCIQSCNRDAFTAGYRSIDLPKAHWFLSATFRFGKSLSEDKKNRVRALLDKRNHSQPIGIPSFGSVFKNPAGDYAGRLIESAGLKGVRVGGAYVSEKHANFILNDGSATATDAVSLIEKIIRDVRDKHGIVLEPEVRLLGETVA